MKNKHQMGIFTICVVLGIIFLSAAKTHAEPRYIAQMNYRPKTFKSQQSQIPFTIDQNYFKNRIREFKQLGYNTVQIIIYQTALEFTAPGVFNTSRNNQGFEQADFEDIIRFAFDQGLEPIVEVSLASKIFGMVKPLTSGSHPDLVDGITGKTHNPYYKFDANTDMLKGIYKPVIDWVVNSYPATTGARRCKYIMVGGDEFDTDSIQEFAEARGGYPQEQMASRAWAKVINDIAGYARTKNLKVIFWGDKFLSRKLGSSDHGIWGGYKPDARFNNSDWSGNMNADMNPTFKNGQPHLGHNHTHGRVSDFTTHKAVNYISSQNKPSIIIADWHYRDSAAIETSQWKWEYPSVDYFQSLGFDSVWITTWNTQFDAFVEHRELKSTYHNARMFTKYGRSKNVGGYIASVWAVDYPAGSNYFNSSVIYEDSIKFMRFTSATRTLSQFSMEDYGKARWEERFQGSPTNYSFKTGGSFENPDNSLELKVQSGTKGVGLINVDSNAKIYPSLFDVEVRALMKMDSEVPNGGKVRLFLTGSKSNIFESFLIFEITETSSGLHFKVMQKTGSGGSQIDFLNFTLNGSGIAAGDTIKVRIRDNKIQKLDYVDESNDTIHNIIAKSGWNGAISSPKAQFPNGAYTMVQFLSPNGNGGSLTSVKISRVLTEARWNWWSNTEW